MQALVLLLQQIQLLLFIFQFIVSHLFFEDHLTLVEALQILLLLLMSLECYFIFFSLLLGIIQGEHVPHGYLRSFRWTTYSLSLDSLVNLILVLSCCPSVCICVFILRKPPVIIAFIQIILILPRSNRFLKPSMQRLPQFPKNIIIWCLVLLIWCQVIAVRKQCRSECIRYVTHAQVFDLFFYALL